MIKKLAYLLALISVPALSHAFVPVRYVQISTNTLTRQSGTAVIGGINVSTMTVSSMTITTLNTSTTTARFFSNPSGQSIYGNFVGSATITGSSVTVPLSGYSQYVVRVDLINNVATGESLFLRFNNDSTAAYSFSTSGFINSVSTVTSCGAGAGTAILLSAVNNIDSSQSTFASCTLNVHTHGYMKIDGTCAYSLISTLNEVNTHVGAHANVTNPPTSIQAWIGIYSGCANQTDPLTGTIGTMFIWGVQ